MYLHHVLQKICEEAQQKMESRAKDDDLEWDVLVEILLLHAMFGLKPVGVNRYFTMMAIHQRFSSCINKEIPSKVIWDHLDSMYDMAALHESEILPFPNEEVDFELPEELGDLVKEKYGISLSQTSSDETETPKNNSSAKQLKKMNPPKVKPNAPPGSNTNNTFATPTPVKPSKNNVTIKVEPRSPSSETSAATVSKVKPEVPFPTKVNKVKRASSPFTVKNVKSEVGSVKDEASDTAPKKTSKHESNSSTLRKVTKSESSANSSSAKKSVKQDSSSSSSKQGKTEALDNSSKKTKSERESLSKKGRNSTTAENSSSKKSSKVEGKKADGDSNRRASDTSTSKSKVDKNSSKGNKVDESDSGSRKSTGKIDLNDKKRKRQKLDDSTKKTPPAKRRRT